MIIMILCRQIIFYYHHISDFETFKVNDRSSKRLILGMQIFYFTTFVLYLDMWAFPDIYINNSVLMLLNELHL